MFFRLKIMHLEKDTIFIDSGISKNVEIIIKKMENFSQLCGLLFIPTLQASRVLL